MVLRAGALDFKDATVERTHMLRDLELKVTFLSNLPSQRDIKVAPHLSFLLNDSPFDALAEAVPFTENRKGEASLQVSGLDIAPYLGYLPASVPVRLQAGVLDAQLRLAFEQAPSPALRLRGQLQLRKVQVTQVMQPAQTGPTVQRDLLSFDALTVQVEDFQPLARRLHIGSVLLEAPHLHVQLARRGITVGKMALTQPRAWVERDAQGRWMFERWQVASPPSASSVVAERSVASKAPASPPAPWSVQWADISLDAGSMAFRDAVPTAPVSFLLSALRVQLKDFAPLAQTAQPSPLHAKNGSAQFAGFE